MVGVSAVIGFFSGGGPVGAAKAMAVAYAMQTPVARSASGSVSKEVFNDFFGINDKGVNDYLGGVAVSSGVGKAWDWRVDALSPSGESIAQEGKLPAHDPKSGAYEVDVPDDVVDAMSATLGTDVSNVRVIANSKWANFLDRLNGFRGYRVDATTLKNTIYLPSHVSPQDFFNNSELMIHEYYHVVNQWNNGRMNVFNYLLSPHKWEAEAINYANDRAYIPNHMLFYQGRRQW